MVETRRSKAPPQRRPNRKPESKVKFFFKVILLSTIQRKMLRIPPKFVRLGPKLVNAVTLETPSGFKRLIRVKRIGEEVWLENGWSEFAESHFISEGYLLVFHYLGNSSFRVVVFNKSASEIEYPLDVINVSDDDDDDVDDVDDVDDDDDDVDDVDVDDDDDDDDYDDEGFVGSGCCNEFREVIDLD